MIYTAPMPRQTFPRCLAAPSLLAHIAIDKYADGLPLNRIENRFARDRLRIDRGTMCRWMEDLGSTLGATIVYAMLAEAKRTAFCFATDAPASRCSQRASRTASARPAGAAIIS